MEQNFNFYKAEKVYGELYLQFPRVMLYGKKYSQLSDSAKIAYMVFRDRLQYSLKNNWIDEGDNVYFIFTNDELCELLNKSKPTAIKIKKELEGTGLLLQKQMGFDPVTKKNYPNRLYLADLEVNATDIYQLQQQDKNAESLGTSGSKDSLLRQKNNSNAESLGMSGSKDSLLRGENAESLGTNGSKDSLLYLYLINAFKDLKDSKDLSENDMFKNSFNPEVKNLETEKEIIDFFIEDSNLVDYYGDKLVLEFKKYAFNNFETFCLFAEKLCFAQQSVEKETGKSLTPFSWNQQGTYVRDQLLRTFKKCIQLERFGKAKSIKDLLFISFKNVFEDYAKII